MKGPPNDVTVIRKWVKRVIPWYANQVTVVTRFASSSTTYHVNVKDTHRPLCNTLIKFSIQPFSYSNITYRSSVFTIPRYPKWKSSVPHFSGGGILTFKCAIFWVFAYFHWFLWTWGSIGHEVALRIWLHWPPIKVFNKCIMRYWDSIRCKLGNSSR